MDVACLVVPNFLVALARRDTPALRGRAVVVGGSPEEHAQVTACSEEAAAAGVTVGTTLRRALALCPNAVFLPLQEGFAAGEAARLTDLLRLYSPLVEGIGPGHAHFEVRGLAKMARMGEQEWLNDLHEAAEGECGMPVQLASAETVFAAHAAAWLSGTPSPRVERSPHPPIAIPGARTTVKPEGGGYTAIPNPKPRSVNQGSEGNALTAIQNPKSKIQNRAVLIPRGSARTFLAALPVEALPVPPAMHTKLRLFGLERLGQLAELRFSAVQAQFGRDGVRAWELARGKDDARIEPGREELRVSEAMELPAPTALSEPLVVGTRALLQKALKRPELRGQSVRKLEWQLGLESGEQVARRFVFREPTSDPARMLFLVRGRIERLQLTAAGVSLGVTLSGLCSEYGHQSNLWPLGPRRWQELLEAVEQLNTRVGEPQVYRIVEVQPWSRIPERQLGLVAFGP